MIRNILIAAAILSSAPAFAGSPAQPVQANATAHEIAASIPAAVPVEARASIERLLANAADAQDTVLADAWRRLALDEIQAARGNADQVAQAR